MDPTARSVELCSIAEDIADALPTEVEEVVLTGTVSRGVADDVSDIEMLVVTRDEPDLVECFSVVAAAGLTELGTSALQAETVALAPDGPNINRARRWLNDGLELLRDNPEP